MSQDLVSLFNMALAHVGDKAYGVSDPEDQSPQAKLCRLFYDSSRRAVLRAGFWPSASRTKRLSLAAEREENPSDDWVEADPEPGFLYAYNSPADMLRPRHLIGYARFSFDNGRLNTNQRHAVLRYTQDVTNVAAWESGLYDCVGYVMAAKITMQRSGKRQDADYLLGLAREQLMVESALAASYDDATYGAEVPSMIAARGYDGPISRRGYIFPTDQLSFVGGLNGTN